MQLHIHLDMQLDMLNICLLFIFLFLTLIVFNMKDKKDKIYYFQEKSNEILDLQDELTTEEIGIYFILKAAYFKYAGELKKENVCQRCKFFGNIEKINQMIFKLFDEIDGNLINNSWLSEINGIKEVSKKRQEIAKARWKADKDNPIEKKKPKRTKKKPVEAQNNPQEPNGLSSQFEDFWQAYIPVKTSGGFVSKGNKELAKVAFSKALKISPVSEIMEGLNKYLKTCQDNARFTKQVVTWLNQKGWQDDFSETVIISKTKSVNTCGSFFD